MQFINQIILGIVQGLTEFLPVSSSGHLAILQNFFGSVDVSFDIFLHLATLLAVLVYFYKDILAIAKDFFTFKTQSENFKLAIYLIIASIPAGIFGFWLNDKIDSIFANLIFVAFGFIISGMFLFTASLLEKNKPLNIKNTFIIGLAQALAILPGISRSGSTVSTGILLGINKEKAIKFSFLLSIPAIIGASFLKINEITFAYSLLVPFILAFLTGLLAIYIFIEKIKVNNLKYFAYYCWLVAILILVTRLMN
jgi:undecaprenyl-diphosphatase